MSQQFQCPHCGALIAQGQIYCGNCKKDIAWKDGRPQATVAQGVETVMKGIWSLILLVLFFGFIFSMCLHK